MKKSVKERFEEKIKYTEDCWLWMGSKNNEGYGYIHVKDRMFRANRISYELYIGQIPEDLLVCHSCDNPTCVNPEHLFLGTNSDNMRDMFSKNRHPIKKGCKLDKEKAEQIRKLSSEGMTRKQLAELFNVVTQNIHAVLNNEIWSN